jgi:hypothetical protein
VLIGGFYSLNEIPSLVRNMMAISDPRVARDLTAPATPLLVIHSGQTMKRQRSAPRFAADRNRIPAVR